MQNPPKTIMKKIKKTLFTDLMRCAIWYHLYNLKNAKNTHYRL